MREWQTVTVASPPGPSWISRFAIGLPDDGASGRRTTAWAPLVSIPLRISICCTPYGVQGRSAVGSPIDELAHVHRMKAVHVLGGIDPIEHLLGVDVLRQRQLDQDAVNRGIGVEPVDDRQQLGLGRCRPEASIFTECMPASTQAFSLLPT